MNEDEPLSCPDCGAGTLRWTYATACSVPGRSTNKPRSALHIHCDQYPTTCGFLRVGHISDGQRFLEDENLIPGAVGLR